MKKSDSNVPKTDTVKLLYRILIQFSIYARGINSDLDPHLSHLRDTLKQRFDLQKFLPRLTELSKTLNTLIEASQHSPYTTATSLFDYLKFNAHSEKDRHSVKQLQQQYKDGYFKSAQQLFLSINKNLKLQRDEASSLLPENKKRLISNLKRILNEANIPSKSYPQFTSLKQQLKPTLSDNDLKTVIDSAVSLFFTIKDHSETEYEKIEASLLDMSNQLTVFESSSQSAKDSIQKTIDEQDIFTTAFTDKVSNIQSSTNKALDLESLKQQINQHLEELSQQLEQHSINEVLTQQQTQQQLSKLKEKLIDMEDETNNLRNKLKQEHDKAFKDSLTGLANRLAYDERVVIEQKHWLRYKKPLSMIVWDIDSFKKINDAFGHQAGDKALIMIAHLIFNNCRETDFVARYGGEEFITLLPETNADKAMVVAEHIRKIISDTDFNYSQSAVNITISCGVTEFFTNDNAQVAFERADAALYKAKQQGRNRCHLTVHP